MRVAPIWIVCVVMCVVICVVQSPQTARARARPVEVRQKARRSRQLEVTLVDEQSPPKPTDIQFGLKPAMFSRIISSDAGTDTESDTDDLPEYHSYSCLVVQFLCAAFKSVLSSVVL
eukprot:m.65712 g.65712  ORF g.65712 m.65712 type:complete len:117 (+) comp49819_c0_seq7:479-829(+)